MWVAGRDEQSGHWSQAGSMGEISCDDLWLCHYPENTFPDNGTEERMLMDKDFGHQRP